MNSNSVRSPLVCGFSPRAAERVRESVVTPALGGMRRKRRLSDKKREGGGENGREQG